MSKGRIDMDNTTIDLKDLIRRILMKWRLLLIFMLVGAVLVTLWGGFNSYTKAEEAKIALEQQEAAGGPAQGEKPVVVPEVVWVSPMNIVLGLFLGAAGVAGVVAVIYVLSPKLRVSGDLFEMFGVPVIGSIYMPLKKNTKIDRWILGLFRKSPSWFTDDMRVSMMCTDVTLAAAKHEVKHLHLTSSCPDKFVVKTLSLFYKNLQGSAERVSCGNSVVYNSEALEQMAAADGVVLVERVDISTYDDIRKEIYFCNRYQIPVLGCIVIE